MLTILIFSDILLTERGVAMNGSIPKICPACGKNMHVRLLCCPSCSTEVQGNFPLDRYQSLTEEQLQFLEIFLRCRGNLKDVGTELGISYPTARNRLDTLLTALGFLAQNEEKIKRLEVLERLKNGEITTDEALTLLQKGENNHV